MKKLNWHKAIKEAIGIVIAIVWVVTWAVIFRMHHLDNQLGVVFYGYLAVLFGGVWVIGRLFRSRKQP